MAFEFSIKLIKSWNLNRTVCIFIESRGGKKEKFKKKYKKGFILIKKGVFMSYIKGLVVLGLSLFSLSVIATPFWRAKKGSQTFYILGTIHTGVSIEDLQCSEIVKDKIQKSNRLFVEKFTPGTEPLYENYKEAIRKLYWGSKEEQIQSQLSEEVKEQIKSRIKAIKLIFVRDTLALHINQGFKLAEDEGQFKDLSEESQNFLIQKGLYDKNKNYLDYFFDIKFMFSQDTFFSHKKYLDAEVIKLALDHNIPIESLDQNKNIISDLEKEITDLYKMKVQEIKVQNTNIDQDIADYEAIKEKLLIYHSNTVSNYKSMDWKSQTKDLIASDALLKNRNESWIKKILNSANQDQSIFIAVGYAHLTTKSDNILNLLESENFKITLIDKESCQF